MARRRHLEWNCLKSVDAPTWLIVASMSGRVLAWMELAPGENLKRCFAEAVAASYAAGWEAEEFDSRTGGFFCRRGEDRRYISIRPSAPKDQSGLWRVPEGATDVGSCVGVR